ncbi:MAG: AtpZ/AtpI family protein [Bacteroidetes bacterium]|nr:AtpZ/AtpI family protein [Bacteroidota bacterium]
MVQEENPKNPKKQRLTDYGKFSAMAFQMGITIALGVWGGMKLDKYFPVTRFPLFTITLSLLSVFASIYFVIKDLLRK